MTKFKSFTVFLTMFVLIGLVSCDDDDNSGPAEVATVNDVINVNGSLSSLEAALRTATGDLPSTLSGAGPFTVFAPDNAAFDALAEEVGFESGADLLANASPDLLATILTYHVVPGENSAADLTEGMTLTTVQGGDLTVTLSDDGAVQLLDARKVPETNPVSTVTATRDNATNGIVHIIDKVLLPQEAINALDIDIRATIVDLALANEDLSILVSALQKTELVGTVAGLDGATVLAPSDTAFLELLDALGDDYNSLDDFDNDAELALLTNVLTYHVLPATADLTAGTTDTAFEGNSVEVIAENGSFAFGDATGVNASTAIANIEARNGTVQVIDKVLLPQAALDFLELLNSPDLATLVANELDLSVLQQALIATNLEDAFVDATNVAFDSTATNFTYFRPATVFAPSDEAFGDLLELLGDDYTGIDSFETEEELALLTNILLYHVVPGRITSGDLAPGNLTTAAGSDIEIIAAVTTEGFVIGDATNDENARIIQSDALARNGVAHVIDKVLLPQAAITFLNSLNDEED